MSFNDHMKKKKRQKTETDAAPATPVASSPSFSEWMAAKKEKSSVEGWLNSVSSFLGDVQTRYEGYNNSQADYDAAYGRSQELLAAADSWRKQYAGNQAAVNSINQAVTMLGQAQEYAKGYYDYYSQWATSDEYDAWKRNQEAATNALTAGDRDQYVAAGEAMGALPGKRGEWYNQVAYLRNNPDELARYEKSAKEAGGAFGGNLTSNLLEDQLEYKAAKYMTDDEYAVYNYLVGKGETEQAQEYLESIEGNLDEERGKAITAEVQGKRLKELKFAFDAGTNQFWHGLANAGSMAFGLDDTYVNESLMYANAEIGGSVKGLHKVVYDLTSTTANMLPSIFLSMASPNAGVTAMGLSAAGNAYTEMQRLGYDNVTSRNYAALVGASEAVLQKVLGGISSLGGASEGIFQKIASNVLPKVDRALARVALELGASMADEGLEEALQSVLEPIFKRITTGESFEGIDWEEVAYSGLLGALSAGLLEGAPTVAGTAYNSIQSKKYYGPDQAALLDEALELNPGNKYVQSLKAKADSGKTLSGMELNRLVEMNEGRLEQSAEAAKTEVKDVAPEEITKETPVAPAEPVQASAQAAKEAEAEEITPTEEKATEAEYEPPKATETQAPADNRAALAAAAKKYNRQAEAMVALYREGQDVEAYDRAFGMAYDMGKAGVALSYAMNSDVTAYLTEEQRKLAYKIGADAASAEAGEQDSENKSRKNGKTGRRKGTVKGEGVTVADLQREFNDTQRSAYKILVSIAEATGIDIVLYKSETDAEGNFVGAQGRFVWKEDTVYIDVNAGLTNRKSVSDLTKYTMLRTFGHEVTHFMEKWNPVRYNELRRVVFDTMTERGENVDDLIRLKLEQDDSGKMTYDLASREVMAEAMADVLPDSDFIRELAENHKTVFAKLLDMLREFVADVKAYFETIQRGRSSTREAKAVMETVGDSVKYLDGIVSLFDRVAAEAVETYQATVAEEAPAETAPVAAEPAVEAERKAAEEKAKAKKKPAAQAGKKGTVVRGEGLNVQKLSDEQYAAYKAAEVLAEVLGTDIVIETKILTKKGKEANGYYKRGDNTIHININALRNGKNVALYTLGHEITHYIKEWSPTKFEALADFVLDQMDVDAETAIADKLASLKRLGVVKETMTVAEANATAREELVAEGMELVLTDGKVLEELAHTDRSIWQKVKAWIQNIISKIRKYYGELNQASKTAQVLRETVDSLEEIERLFTEGVREAGERTRTAEAGETTETEGDIIYSPKAENGVMIDPASGTAMLSVDDIPKTEQEIDDAVNRLVAKLGVDESRARQWVQNELSLATLILRDDMVDYAHRKADRRLTAIVKNSDYKQGTLDFSNICRKRREYTRMMQRIQQAFPNRRFTAEEFATIRKIMVDEGLEVACGLCYVEDRRQNEGYIAETFQRAVEAWKKGNRDTYYDTKNNVESAYNKGQAKAMALLEGGDYVPTIADLTTVEGMEKMGKDADKGGHPDILRAWKAFNNARGMSSARLLTNEAEYQRQILKYNKARVKAINDLGGLRVFSFSDFEEFHLLDIVQAVQDCAAMGIKIQFYTKVPSFALLMADTKAKGNLSLIPLGDLGYEMKNGKRVLVYDPVEGIDFNDKAFKEVARGNPNIGTILVGINDEHIRTAMEDDFIDYIIPFHTGQTEVVRQIKKIGKWKNYKNEQVDKPWESGSKAKPVNIYTDVIAAAEREGDPIRNERQFVERFLKVCEERGLRPRFSGFLNTNAEGKYVYTKGYYKLLLDFKMFDKDGTYLPQEPVIPEFKADLLHKLTKKYVAGEKAKTEAESPAFQRALERVEAEVVGDDEGRMYSIDEDPDTDYLAAVERGDIKTAQRMVDEAADRAMPHSILREGAAINKGEEAEGTLIKMFHGSGSKGFYEFTSNDGMLGKGVYVTSNWDEAVGYAIERLGIEETEDGGYLWGEEEFDGIGSIGEALEAQGYVRAFYADVTDPNDVSTSAVYWEDVIALVRDGSMLKSAEPVTYDDNGNVIPVSRRFNAKTGDVRYQQRTNTLTDREVLSMATERLEGTPNLTEGERDALRIFQKRLETLQTLTEERIEQGRLYKEQQFGSNVDRAAAKETLNRMHVLDDKIKAANEDVLSVENKEVLRRVLVKARGVVEEQERRHGKEILDRWRDRTRNAAAIKKYRTRIETDVKTLSDWILKPDGKNALKHVPDVLKNTVIPFLTSIDFTSKRQLNGGEATKADTAFVERLEKLQRSLFDGDMRNLYAEYDLPPYFESKLAAMIDSVKAITKNGTGEYVINRMTAEELQELSSVIRVLKSAIVNANKFHANAMFQHVDEAGGNTVSELSSMASNNGQANGVSNFVFWQQIRPAYAFERFGEGGRAIYDGLRRGQAKLAFNTEKIVEFSKSAYTPDEVKGWERQVLEVKLSDNTVAKIKASQAMAFYELYKQPDSKAHILGGGIRISTYTVKGEKISDGGHVITEADAAKIIDALTPRQKEVADKLQRFMADQGGAWGNHVSVARFGEEMFTNEQYFPINSDGQLLPSTADKAPENASLYALLNMSFTKSRQEGASNRIVLYSIFDVFSNHMASMAQYNAMALPVLDAVKWFNYRQKDPLTGQVSTGVRDQMIRVYGVPEEKGARGGRMGYAEAFVMGILKSFNGTDAQGAQSDSLGMTTLRRYNMAQIAYNFRVVVQQPLSILRAALLIDYKSILRGLRLSPKAIAANVQEMQQHSGIAAWKALGFYDVNVSRGLTEIIKNESTTMDKIREFGMIGAEKMDAITWAAIWSACKEEVARKRSLKLESPEFFDAVTALFEDVIYKTQVVDSILTKNEFMRSKGFWARAVGSFMSEPSTTASMVIDAYDKYNLDRKRGMDSHAAWAKNKAKIGRTMYVYAISQATLAAVTAVIDALRDDDDYEEFYEKWLDAFAGNAIDELLPFNKLPILSDFYDLVKEILSILGVDTYGNPPQSVFMQWYDSLVKGVEILYDKITGEDTNYTWYSGIYKMLQAVSGMVGMPAASATREIVTAWNNTVGAMAPSLKVKTYDAGDLSEIKFSYLDGNLAEEEATALLLEKGLAEDENEAYFIISGWDAGEGYSRYDALYDAVLNGGDFDAAMEDLISHGYKRDEVISQLQSQIGRWYSDEESDVRITKQRAEELLDKYTDLSRGEITKVINRWSSKVVTGTAYNDIADEFLSGKITANRAVEMYARYGTMSREEAKQKVEVLSFIKKHPDCQDITYAAMESYNAYCEPAGISAEEFYDVWKHSATVKADVDKNGNAVPNSKKAKMLKYINSMRLTKRQKDALYRAFGWSDDGLSDAPWH